MTLAPPRPPGLDDAILLAAAGDLAGSGSLTFLVGEQSLGYQVVNGRFAGDEGASRAEAGAGEAAPHNGTVVRLDAAAWADLVGQVRSFINLYLSGALIIERGSFEHLADWDPALKYLHAGIPPYHPARADLGGRDPGAGLTLDARDSELRAQLQTMGFLHVRGVFTEAEMAAANADVDRLAGLARKGDDESWWVTGEDDQDVLCRLVYATLRSPVLAALESDPRIERLGRLFDATMRIAPDRMEGTAVLIKVPGRTKGLSNIPWHQDCGMGGHSIFCPAVSIGIQLTGSNAATGNLHVVPGSHGQTLHYQWQQRLEGVPVVQVDTAPGDVTVHVQDVMHASPKPTGTGGRRTMYVTHYPSTLWDHVGPGEAYNDLVRNRTQEVAKLG